MEHNSQKFPIVVEPMSTLQELVVFVLPRHHSVVLLSAYLNMEHHLFYESFKLAVLGFPKIVLVIRFNSS